MSELPTGWTKTTLTDLVIFALGGDWGKDEPNGVEYEKVKVIRGTDFKSWRKEKGHTAAERWVKQSSLYKRRLSSGDVVVEVSGGGPTQPVGRTILIDDATLQQNNLPMICSNFFRQVRLSENVDPTYVNYFLSRAYAKGVFDEYQTQTTNLRNLNFSDFLERTEIHLAPLNEQRRIVAKLKMLLGKVDACQQRMENIPRILKRFRQAVLAAACSGRLTADWRTMDLNVEPNAGELPTSWKYEPFKSLIESSFYGPRFGAESYSDVGVPTIRTTDIRYDGSIVLIDAPCIPVSEKELEKYGLQQGDLLVTRTGATIGKCALYDPSIGPAIPSAYLIRFRLKQELINPHYALRFLMSPTGQELLLGGATAVAQPNVNATTISKFIISLPPLAEQQEIVCRVEALFKIADQLEARYQKAKAHIDKLQQSILAKAFRGELVPQDPYDEPASVLLERIRAERENGHVKVSRKTPSKAGRRSHATKS